MKKLNDHKHYKKNCICSSSYPFWIERPDLKKVDFTKLHKMVAKAVKKGLNEKTKKS